MITVLKETNPVARNDYYCMASLFIRDCGRPDYFDCIKDYRDYIKAKENGFKIKKGDKYLYQANVAYGDFYTFKAIPDMHRICLKYDLYPEI